MGRRLAGICFIKMDGAQLTISGSVEVPWAPTSKKAVMGLTGNAGYDERAQRPFIKLEAITTPDFPRAQVANGTNMTITAQFANGQAYTLTGAWLEGDDVVGNMVDGKTSLEFSGISGFWE